VCTDGLDGRALHQPHLGVQLMGAIDAAIEQMTEEQTVELAVFVLNLLTFPKVVQVLQTALSAEDQEELSLHLENE
jgi:hypothetical protein